MIWFVVGLIFGFAIGAFLSDMMDEDNEQK